MFGVTVESSNILFYPTFLIYRPATPTSRGSDLCFDRTIIDALQKWFYPMFAVKLFWVQRLDAALARVRTASGSDRIQQSRVMENELGCFVQASGKMLQPEFLIRSLPLAVLTGLRL